MWRMTDRRLAKAEPVLERHITIWIKTGVTDVRGLETELKRMFDIGYKEAQSGLEDLLRRPRYRLLALYYMQHIGAMGPPAEFKSPLAKAYDCKLYDSADGHAARDAFWAKLDTPAKRKRSVSRA